MRESRTESLSPSALSARLPLGRTDCAARSMIRPRLRDRHDRRPGSQRDCRRRESTRFAMSGRTAHVDAEHALAADRRGRACRIVDADSRGCRARARGTRWSLIAVIGRQPDVAALPWIGRRGHHSPRRRSAPRRQPAVPADTHTARCSCRRYALCRSLSKTTMRTLRPLRPLFGPGSLIKRILQHRADSFFPSGVMATPRSRDCPAARRWRCGSRSGDVVDRGADLRDEIGRRLEDAAQPSVAAEVVDRRSVLVGHDEVARAADRSTSPSGSKLRPRMPALPFSRSGF